MGKVIAILVMAEEKWLEADFLRREIEARGCSPLMIDIGLLKAPGGMCDVSREEILSLSGVDPAEVSQVTDRGKRMPIMQEGAKEKVRRLHAAGKLDGIISLGGTTGTQMGTAVMRTLPFGLPKLAVSSTAAVHGFASKSIGTSDVALMPSVVEIAGLNDLMRNVLSRAAGAICGMVEGSAKAPVSLRGRDARPLVAMTHFGPCEECAVNVRQELERRGYQVIGFSASGVGDRAMEEMIEQEDIFAAMIDLAPGGVGEEIFGFTRAAGPTRLEAAGKRGTPQIVAPCGLNLGSPRKRDYTPEYRRRKRYEYDAARAFIRLSEEELRTVARTIASKLNKARGPVKVLIPLGGWSSVDKRGTDFYDAIPDRAFTDELRKHLRRDIEIREIDADLEAPEFGKAVIGAFDELMNPGDRPDG